MCDLDHGPAYVKYRDADCVIYKAFSSSFCTTIEVGGRGRRKRVNYKHTHKGHDCQQTPTEMVDFSADFWGKVRGEACERGGTSIRDLTTKHDQTCFSWEGCYACMYVCVCVYVCV